MFILVKHVVKFYKVSMTGFEPARLSASVPKTDV